MTQITKMPVAEWKCQRLSHNTLQVDLIPMSAILNCDWFSVKLMIHWSLTVMHIGWDYLLNHSKCVWQRFSMIDQQHVQPVSHLLSYDSGYRLQRLRKSMDERLTLNMGYFPAWRQTWVCSSCLGILSFTEVSLWLVPKKDTTRCF